MNLVGRDGFELEGWSRGAGQDAIGLANSSARQPGLKWRSRSGVSLLDRHRGRSEHCRALTAPLPSLTGSRALRNACSLPRRVRVDLPSTSNSAGRRVSACHANRASHRPPRAGGCAANRSGHIGGPCSWTSRSISRIPEEVSPVPGDRQDVPKSAIRSYCRRLLPHRR